jgi:hypothetical protein
MGVYHGDVFDQDLRRLTFPDQYIKCIGYSLHEHGEIKLVDNAQSSIALGNFPAASTSGGSLHVRLQAKGLDPRRPSWPPILDASSVGYSLHCHYK